MNIIAAGYTISALLAGFSLVSALILLFAYLFFLENMRKSAPGKIACTVVLLCLAALQFAHYLFFTEGRDLLSSRVYGTLLVLIPPAFFFFGREILFPEVRYRRTDFLHALVPVLSFAVAIKFIPGYAFLFGTAYTSWFARTLYKLKDQRSRYKFEFFFFAMFAVMAVVALILGLALPYLDASIFYLSYSNAIALAMLLIVAALLIFPELLSDIMLITEMAYAKSKLVGIDTPTKIAQLNELMLIEKHYESEDLSLATVAELLDLSSHQLSELINTHHSCSFPKFVRQHRITAAKRLLIEEVSASVLSISMMTGFKSQSSFYTAFKEITGESPASYRKKTS
ncbi:MAG: AraC-like DNA-binding protein [Arenicella sp.]|jgi:AraC-like DNA-binding protein